jgi:type IV pilus assembly protein PilQ
MGNMTNSWTLVSRRTGLAAAALACAFLWTCASGGGGGDERSRVAPAPEPQIEAARLETIRVTGSDEEARLEMSGDGPLIWTQYRDAQGRLVVELPNTVPAPGLQAPDGVGVIASVALESVDSETRPLTRVTVTASGETEHELGSEGEMLVVTLVPIQGPSPSPALAYEPLVTEEPIEEADRMGQEPVAGTEMAAWAAAPMGTPEAPIQGPPPAGVVATRLDEVEVSADGDTPVVAIRGDGDFRYSTFQLQDPTRFVLDLHGVTNLAPAATIPGGIGGLEQVRVAQFKSAPDAVSRVVLDLSDGGRPMLEATGSGLEIRLGGALMTAELPAPPPAPEPVTVAEQATPPTAGEVAMEGTLEPLEQAPGEEPPWDEVALEDEAVADVEPGPAFPPPMPVPPPEPSDVALFEAQDVDQEVVLELEERAERSDAYQAQDVSTTEPRYVGEPISFTLRDADIKEVLRTFARISGLNMVIQPGVSGSVTVELEQVPWDQALDIILKTNGLGYELEGNIMRIAPRALLAEEARAEAERAQARAMAVPLKTVLKRVSYSDAQSVATLLQSGAGRLLSVRGSVVIDQRTNTLIIKELPEVMDTVLSVIDQVDVPEPQVMIEARIVETTKDFSRSLGVEWGFTGLADAEHGNTTGLQFPNNVASEGGVSLLTGGQNAFVDLTLGNVLNTFVLDARLQAAESEGLVNILSAPRVATLNNATAEIQSGLQIPIQTVSNNTVTVQFVNATLRLNVTPHVTAEGTVLMDIDVQKREPQLAFAIAGAANAPISTKQARTRVIVRDGGTTVIGGIYKVTTNSGQDRVPGLANVPIIGHLFKNRRESHQNDELLIFITPRVIKL